jgi:hypothetical protein
MYAISVGAGTRIQWDYPEQLENYPVELGATFCYFGERKSQPLLVLFSCYPQLFSK